MSIIRGVDGCKAGWLCLTLRHGDARPTAAVFDADARALLAQPAAVTAIDIPIGLASSGARRVDGQARSLLGSLTSSVFPSPVRATLAATSYEAACLASHKACGKKISKQTFAILPKIRDVDAILRESPALVSCVFEVHPEVCFVHWNGRHPLRHPKTSGFGFVERLRMVQGVYGSSAEDIRAAVRRSQATDDDILDAFAALWSAQRIYDQRAIRIDDAGEQDECGLPMQMWA